MNSVVDFYENYDEEKRLTTNKARRIEFITTTCFLDKYIEHGAKIFDVAAGTGIYTFYYAENGHEVYAADITPGLIEVLKAKLLQREDKLKVYAEVNNAVDLSKYESEAFDVVLCFGPIYHLLKDEERNKCLAECLRVLRKGGILAVAYINKYFIFPTLSNGDKRYIKKSVAEKIIRDGIIKSDDEDCFWTDAYFTTPDEIEKTMNRFSVGKLEHIAADGISPLLGKKIDEMSDEQYNVWVNYHLETCREKSILGMSNHGLYICRKM